MKTFIIVALIIAFLIFATISFIEHRHVQRKKRIKLTWSSPGANHYRRFAEEIFASNFDPEVTSERIEGKHPALAWPYGGLSSSDPRFSIVPHLVPANAFCPGCDAPQPGPHAYDCFVRIERSQMPVEDDSGEPLPAAMSAQPNIGGEDHPPYAGPHYESLHGPQTRFVGYDMLHDPIPGTAVHTVKNGFGVAGPIEDGEPT